MLVRRIPCRANERHGASLVEFCLVIPIYIVIFFGMIDIARGFMVKALLDNAARVGCRTGSLQGKSNADVLASIKSTFAGQGINGTTATITVNGNAVDVSSALSGDIVRVVITVPVGNVTWLPGTGFLTGSLTGTYSVPRA
jgi:Flp pilus assembly protein TadG